jgi:hypothetical protein
MIVGVGCFLTLPVLVHGISVQSDDGATHVVWYTSFATQFWAGDLYPRWLADLNNGLGSPAFFFYPPVPYFLTSVVKPLFGASDPNGIHQLGLSAALSVILSGIFTWLWCREFVDDLAAVAGGVAFMATPYHLMIDLYTRGSFAELWSFAWIPLILLFVHKACRGDRWAPAGLAVAYALLIGTHLPTTVIFSLVPVGYAFVAADLGVRLRSVVVICISMIIGAGLAGIFLYPAMTMQEYVFVDQMSLGHFSYSNWLLLSSFYYEQDVDLRPIERIFFVSLDLIALAGGSYFLGRKSADPIARRTAVFWAAVGLAAFLMTTDLSRPVWALITTLQKVQFPWRFGVVISVSVTALLALCVDQLRQPLSSGMVRRRLTVVFLTALWAPYAAWGFSHYSEPVKVEDVEFKKAVIKAKRDQAEYRPRWSQTMAALDWNSSKNEDEWSDKLQQEYDLLIARTAAGDPNVPRATLTSGRGQVNVISSRPREIRLRTAAAVPSQMLLLQFYYPGWQASVLDTGAVLDVQPAEPDGLLSVSVPAGVHEVVVELTRTEAERIGQWISGASLACVILYAVILGGFTSRKRPATT